MMVARPKGPTASGQSVKFPARPREPEHSLPFHGEGSFKQVIYKTTHKEVSQEERDALPLANCTQKGGERRSGA
jgi:hypothetical protein